MIGSVTMYMYSVVLYLFIKVEKKKEKTEKEITFLLKKAKSRKWYIVSKTQIICHYNSKMRA